MRGVLFSTCVMIFVAIVSTGPAHALGPKPQPPRNVTLKDNMDGTFLISWLHPEDTKVPVAYYDIEYKTDGSWKKLNAKYITDATSFTAKRLIPGTMYTFRVFAKTLTSFQASSEVQFAVPIQDEYTISPEVCAAPQEGLTINTTGAVQVIICCHDDDDDAGPNHGDVPSTEQCTARDGFCVETGDHCNGRIKLLHNSCNDHCTCCVPGCPDGFFMSDGSTQCFKLYMDEDRQWNEAKEKCEAEGLIMAQPTDTVAVALRKDILQTYGYGHDASVWLDARADGSKFVWQRNMTELSNDSPLWKPMNPGKWLSNVFCLGLHVNEDWWNSHPEQPYSSYACHWAAYTLCELIRE